MAQLGVTHVKVDAREMRCAKEKSFFFGGREGKKRSIYLSFEISPRGERNRVVPFLSIVSLFLLIVKKRRARFTKDCSLKLSPLSRS